MNRFLYILFFVVSSFWSVSLSAQSAAALESKANQASDRKEKMTYLYQASEKYLNGNPKKASETAHSAYNIAAEINDVPMMAKSAYINAEGFSRQGDFSGAKIRYNRGKEHAITNNDIDFAVKCLNRMAEMARRQGNNKEASSYTAQASDLKNNSGSVVGTSKPASSGTTPSQAAQRPTPTNSADMAALRKQFQAERDQLERDRQRLAAEVSRLQRERDALNSGMTQLQQREKSLNAETQQAKQDANQKNQALAVVSEEKKKVEQLSGRKQRLLEALQSEKALDSIARQQEQQEQEVVVQRANNLRNISLIGLGSAILIAFLMYKRFRENKKQQRILEEKNKVIKEEQERSEELLLNILPAPIANELKENGKAKARRYETASVMFTDFQNFTKISEQLTPEQLVHELDTYFKAFDFIISQYKIEKIKTIGDAYMCATGLSDRVSTPVSLVKAALEIQQYMREVRTEKIRKNEPYFEVKIGINTGAVVAGVVGVNKFAYDIWGDAVNVAARMQEACEAGCVNISESTFWAVKYNFRCRPRGKVAVKNKGEVEMYYADGMIE